MHIVNVITHLRNSDYRNLKVKKEQLSFARYCKSSLHPNPRNKNMEDAGVLRGLSNKVKNERGRCFVGESACGNLRHCLARAP